MAGGHSHKATRADTRAYQSALAAKQTLPSGGRGVNLMSGGSETNTTNMHIIKHRAGSEVEIEIA